MTQSKYSKIIEIVWLVLAVVLLAIALHRTFIVHKPRTAFYLLTGLAIFMYFVRKFSNK